MPAKLEMLAKSRTRLDDMSHFKDIMHTYIIQKVTIILFIAVVIMAEQLKGINMANEKKSKANGVAGFATQSCHAMHKREVVGIHI